MFIQESHVYNCKFLVLLLSASKQYVMDVIERKGQLVTYCLKHSPYVYQTRLGGSCFVGGEDHAYKV